MKKFMTIWAGELISNIGSGMTAFALLVYVYQLTGSVTWVSIVTLLAYLPTILLNPIGGILADRFDRRFMMICGDLLSALGLLYILISIQTGHIGIVPIVIGVTINSVFVSMLDPSYRATVTDLLTEEEYAKASGLVQMACNAKYLISPAIAGVILGFSDIRVILIIDISTFFVTVFAVASVRRNIQKVKPRQGKFNFFKEFKEGMQYIVKDKGVTDLVILMAFMCFFIGCVQTLMIPMVLPIGSVKTVGFVESISAIGMVIGSVVISINGIKKQYSKILVVGLIVCGCFMALIGTSTNMSFIVITCILFFTSLPFVNTCADVLVRVSIPNEVQGRVWGLISLLTQIGCVIAYATCGIFADNVFEPMMQGKGVLADSIGKVIGTGEGRGIGLMLIIAGVLMVVVALVLGNKKSIREIEVINCEHEYKNVKE
ncbi:MFS transporter [Sedimentibacter sp. zth1]|uniref:MFS transporter n=1 Tax=Sedimentibacter sp. zth1 TaxID=2816908 RepID=UPI001A92363F|nr:MFS transporter [Sedimentibacter sp. zth1]QSX05668.1 MFS transporter [Sedimentibacter sp. zth1]